MEAQRVVQAISTILPKIDNRNPLPPRYLWKCSVMHVCDGLKINKEINNSSAADVKFDFDSICFSLKLISGCVFVLY
jgi:hypothetical protein